MQARLAVSMAALTLSRLGLAVVVAGSVGYRSRADFQHPAARPVPLASHHGEYLPGVDGPRPARVAHPKPDRVGVPAIALMAVASGGAQVAAPAPADPSVGGSAGHGSVRPAELAALLGALSRSAWPASPAGGGRPEVGPGRRATTVPSRSGGGVGLPTAAAEPLSGDSSFAASVEPCQIWREAVSLVDVPPSRDRFEPIPSASLPEPSSVVMFGSGVSALAVLTLGARRRTASRRATDRREP